MHLIIQMQETGVGFNYDPHIQAGSPPSPQWLSVANEQQWEAKAAHTQPEGEEVYIHNIHTYIRICIHTDIHTYN